jgi:hypothetical protein
MRAKRSNMKTFNVSITTTLDGFAEIQANTAEEAMEIARQMLWDGDISTLEFEPFTEVHYAEEAK